MQQTSAKEAALNIFAILGFIALLIAGLWATIQLLQLAASFAGSIATNKNGFAPLSALSQPSISIALADTEATPNTPFTVAWNGKHVSNNGTLLFTYACREGLVLKVKPSEDAEYAIPCNAPYTVPKNTTSLIVTPLLTTHEAVEVPLTVAYNENGKTVKDVATITVDGVIKAPLAVATPIPAPVAPVAPASPVVPVVPAPQPVPTPALPPQKPVEIVTKPVQKSDARGFVDLEARIIAVGKIAANGAVSPRAVLAKNEPVSVTIEVLNSGTKAVRNWTFTLALPTDPAFTFTSEAQPTLYAGSKATVTISFDKAATGQHPLTLTVDPQQKIVESNRENNVAQAIVTIR